MFLKKCFLLQIKYFIIYSERDSKDEKIFEEEEKSMKDIKSSSFTE